MENTMTPDEIMHWLLSSGDSPISFWRDQRHVSDVADLYKRRISGDDPEEREWVKAEMNSLEYATYPKKNSERFAAWASFYASKGEYKSAVWEALKVVKKLKNYGVDKNNETIRDLARLYDLKIKK